MEKKKLYQTILWISIVTLIGSYFIYLFYNNPKELTPPKQNIIDKKINLTANITKKEPTYFIEYLNKDQLNLTSFGKVINEKILDEGNNLYLFDVQINTTNISNLINYIKNNSIKLNKIKQKVWIKVVYLNKNLEEPVFITLSKVENKSTLNLICTVEYVDNVISRIVSCYPE